MNQNNKEINISQVWGIYLISNKVDASFYVGSTARSFAKRWSDHRRAFNAGKNSPYLQHAWNKYGEENFEFSVLEVVESKDKLVVLEREQYWIDYLKPEYNINPKAESRLGSKQTPETIAKISGYVPWNKGLKYHKTPEQVEAMKLIRGEQHHCYGGHMSEEAKRKSALSHKKLTTEQEQEAYELYLSGEYSIDELKDKFNCTFDPIRNSILKKLKEKDSTIISLREAQKVGLIRRTKTKFKNPEERGKKLSEIQSFSYKHTELVPLIFSDYNSGETISKLMITYKATFSTLSSVLKKEYKKIGIETHHLKQSRKQYLNSIDMNDIILLGPQDRSVSEKTSRS